MRQLKYSEGESLMDIAWRAGYRYRIERQRRTERPSERDDIGNYSFKITSTLNSKQKVSSEGMMQHAGTILNNLLKMTIVSQSIR
jgi:hypothetical protein